MLTSDHAGSLRAGTLALEAALNAVKAGAARTALVLASDCRLGAPRGALEARLGDGAAAFLVGDANPIARFEGSSARADEIQDQWRIDGERFTHSWEDRFVVQEGVEPNLVAVLTALFAEARRRRPATSRARRSTPTTRAAPTSVAKQAGIARERLQDPLIGRLGNTGVAYAPMLLAAALAQASPGERMRRARATATARTRWLFETTAALEKLAPRLGVARSPGTASRPCAATTPILRSRGLDPQEWEGGADLGLSATIRFRERDADIGFIGARCTHCGQIQLPRPRVCIRCRTKDQWEPARLSDKRGRVLSYTFDYFFPTAEPPTIAVMTEVEGCRVQVQLANARPDEVRLDMPVEYVFRKIHDAGGKANYFWKASPLAQGAPA